MSHTYNPKTKVADFVAKHGELGRLVLEVFNTVNPLRCYYGDDCNPDEYLGYAERFITALERESIFLNGSRKAEVLSGFVLELFRRCFGPTQIVEGWVSESAIEMLRSELFRNFELVGLTQVDLLPSGSAG